MCLRLLLILLPSAEEEEKKKKRKNLILSHFLLLLLLLLIIIIVLLLLLLPLPHVARHPPPCAVMATARPLRSGGVPPRFPAPSLSLSLALSFSFSRSRSRAAPNTPCPRFSAPTLARASACVGHWNNAFLRPQRLYSSVAEQQSCKLKVLGSIPSGGSLQTQMWHLAKSAQSPRAALLASTAALPREEPGMS